MIWHKIVARSYRATLDGITVAEAHNTSATDPWDWYLAQGVKPVVGGKTSGVADSLRSAKRAVASALGIV